MHTTLQHWNLNGAGLRASFLNWGARLARLDVETALGWRTVTLGFPTLDGFLTDPETGERVRAADLRRVYIS